MPELSEIDATSREEMVCPHCGQQTLQKHPRAEQKSSKKDKILYGTTCGNPDCHKYNDFVDPNRLNEQYSGSKLGGLPSKNVIITLALIVGGLFVVAQMFGFITIGATAHEVTGTVTGPNGEPVNNATVVMGETTVTTNSSGAYSMKVKSGSYKMFVKPPTDSNMGGTQVYEVTVQSDGSVQFTNADKSGTKFSLSQVNTLQASGKTANGQVTVEYDTPVNGGLTEITLIGDTSDTVRGTKTVSLPVGQSKTITVPSSSVESQQFTVQSNIATKSVSNQYTYTGPVSVSPDGNLAPSDARIVFGSKAASSTESVSGRVTNSRTFTINITGDEPTSLTAVLSEGSSEATESVSGTWSGTDPTIQISESSAPATVRTTLQGSVSKSSESYSGTISGDSIQFDVNGNMKATGATINFNGGDASKTQIGKDSTSASGQDGTTEKKVKVGTAQSSGTYVLDTDYSIDTGGDYVVAGYIVDGTKHKVSEGQKSVELSLDKGDTVYAWIKAGNEVSSSKTYNGDGSDIVHVSDYTVQPTEPAAGETVTIYATLKNTGSQADDIDVHLYADGSNVLTQNYAVDAGATKEVKVGTVSFDSKSVHTISVNGKSETIVKVDGATVDYGAGSISGTLYKKAGDGKVSVDADGDGEFECTASATGGSCDLGRLPAGTTDIAVQESGVKNTKFTVSYTARSAPKNVKVDLDNDGTIDATHDGLLVGDETLTASTELDAGSHTVDIQAEGTNLEYEIQWAQSGVIKSPKITVDGETVVDSSDSYKGTKRFDLGQVSPGEHTITFSADQGSYTAEVQWSESPQKSYPPVYVGGTKVCSSDQIAANGGICTFDGERLKGGAEIALDSSYNGKQFTVEYTAQSAPSTVKVTRNGTVVQTISAEDGSVKNGNWVYKSSLSVLESGSNKVTVEYTSPSGFSVEPSASIKYTALFSGPSEPKVVVINSEGEKHTKTVPESKLNDNGVLDGTAKMSVPYEWFTTGENTIKVVTGNGVPVEVKIVTKSSIDQEISISSGDSSNSENESDTSDGS